MSLSSRRKERVDDFCFVSQRVSLKHSVKLMPSWQVVIENPVINSPFDEPRRHFRFSDEGITNQIVDQRRTSLD